MTKGMVLFILPEGRHRKKGRNYSVSENEGNDEDRNPGVVVTGRDADFNFQVLRYTPF